MPCIRNLTPLNTMRNVSVQKKQKISLIVTSVVTSSAQKMYLVDTHGNHLGKTIPMSTDKIYFGAKVIAPDKALFSNQIVLKFFLSLHKNICCGYSSEAPH